MERFYKMLTDGVRPELVAKLMERNNCEVYLGHELNDWEYIIDEGELDDLDIIFHNGNIIPMKDLRCYWDIDDSIVLFEVDYDVYGYSTDEVLMVCGRKKPTLKVVENKPYTWYERRQYKMKAV